VLGTLESWGFGPNLALALSGSLLATLAGLALEEYRGTRTRSLMSAAREWIGFATTVSLGFVSAAAYSRDLISPALHALIVVMLTALALAPASTVRLVAVAALWLLLMKLFFSAIFSIASYPITAAILMLLICSAILWLVSRA
jgi:hypothetical protein